MMMAMNPFMMMMITMRIVTTVTAIMQTVWMTRWMNWIGKDGTENDYLFCLRVVKTSLLW
jgi:hypothetical protein